MSVILVAAMAGCMTQPTSPAPAAAALGADSSIDQVLDALDARGQNLRALGTDVTLIESDATTGDDVRRTGRFLLQTTPEGSARARIVFDKKIANNRIAEEKIEYALDGQNLIDRNYRSKTQVTRQVLKPGEKVNLLKLGQGPFPLPIGQKKEEVHRLFEVEKIDAASDDPAGTVHIRLKPKPDTQFAGKFLSIDAWVDLSNHMPRRIQTVDPNGVTVKTTELSNLQINPSTTDADFALAKIDEKEWNLYNEAYDR
jgi:hypothetical protein